MEKLLPSSVHICQSILKDTLTKTNNLLPPTKQQLSLFSCQQSQKLSSAIFKASKHFYDQPAVRLSQDTSQIKLRKKKISRGEDSTMIKFNKNPSEHIFDKKGSYHQIYSLKSGGLQLVPLDVIDNNSDDETDQSQDLQSRMRDAKAHQEILRIQYENVMKKQHKKPLKSVLKVDGKAPSQVAVYDYDGSLISPFKADFRRFPSHFLDLEVAVHQKESDRVNSPKANKKKFKPTAKVGFTLGKPQQLKISESVFLKELSNVNWVEGVEVTSNKEECRKIHGYQQSRSIRKKKKLNLFSTSQGARQMRFQDLENYRKIKNYESLKSMNIVSEKLVGTGKTILDKEESGCRTIKIANNRALEFLIKDVGGQSKDKSSSTQGVKKSHFHPESKD